MGYFEHLNGARNVSSTHFVLTCCVFLTNFKTQNKNVDTRFYRVVGEGINRSV